MSGPTISSIRARLLDTVGQDGSRRTFADAGLFALTAWVHIVLIAELPRGLYIDELSIGYNAYQIATHGHDEFGVRWPLYFKAFGEHKNPLYVYASGQPRW